ncbi:MAG: hypothetical protein K6F96_05730 [Bacteroidales bacterium]|nr:hypothetical protein [Bacteroidales bacterium]
MSKVGIYRIGFVEQNEDNDVWVQTQVQQNAPSIRGAAGLVIQGLRKFKRIDQKVADLNQELVIDDSGMKYTIQLDFTVRNEEDIALAGKYEGRPVVMYVWTVDGNQYKLGKKSDPVRMTTKDIYQGVTTREVSVSVKFDSKYRLL